MKTNSPKEILQLWAEGFDQHDAEKIASLYSNDATNIQIAIGIPVKGKSAILADLKSFFAAFPNSYTKVENIFQDGQWGVIEWLGGGTFLGEFNGLSPTGRSFEIRGCGFFHIPNGLIEFQRGYWDKASWFSQIGLTMD